MQRELAEQKLADVATVSAEPHCRHHWMIEPPAGPTSKGHCKLCGEERFFVNSTLEWVWDNPNTKAAANGAPSKPGQREPA